MDVSYLIALSDEELSSESSQECAWLAAKWQQNRPHEAAFEGYLTTKDSRINRT
jgi:hypothetical protein